MKQYPPSTVLKLFCFSRPLENGAVVPSDFGVSSSTSSRWVKIFSNERCQWRMAVQWRVRLHIDTECEFIGQIQAYLGTGTKLQRPDIHIASEAMWRNKLRILGYYHMNAVK